MTRYVMEDRERMIFRVDREALVSPSHSVRWTWKEFNERVDALAAGLLALGLERGARIGVWSLNRPEWTLTQFAAAEAGLVFVTINPAYRLHELEYALRKVGCAALVYRALRRFRTIQVDDEIISATDIPAAALSKR